MARALVATCAEVYLLDAAGERQSDWVHLTAPSERLGFDCGARLQAQSG